MGNKIIWSLLILLISFTACGKSSKNNVARQPNIEKIDTASQKDDEEFNTEKADESSGGRIDIERSTGEEEDRTDDSPISVSIQIAQLVAEKELLIAEKELLRVEKVSLQQDHEIELAKVRDQAQPEITELMAQNEDLTAANKALTSERDALTTDKKETDIFIAEQKRWLDKATNDAIRLEKLVNSNPSRRDFNQQDRTIRDLEAALADFRTRIEDLNARHKEEKGELADSCVALIKDKEKQMQETIEKQKDDLMERMAQQYEKFQKENKALDEEITRLKDRIVELETPFIDTTPIDQCEAAYNAAFRKNVAINTEEL